MDDDLVLPLADDMHVHLRNGNLMKEVAPRIRDGGCDRVLVMPNTKPPLLSCQDAANYRNELIKVNPHVDYRMTLYLSNSTSIHDLRQNAKKSFITGLKLYPKGVTTNSEDGVMDIEVFFPIFREMQRLGLFLHIHSEFPSVSPFIAETRFIDHIHRIKTYFPHLKIVLEHISVEESIDIVKSSSNIAGTITPHHLEISATEVFKKNFEINCLKTDFLSLIDQVHNFCKPIPKHINDKIALHQVLKEGNTRFFLGSDSAPHLRSRKECECPAAGIYTTPLIMAYLADTFERINSLNVLKDFACRNASLFFNMAPKEISDGSECVILRREMSHVPSFYPVCMENDSIVPFRAGETLNYRCVIETYEG